MKLDIFEYHSFCSTDYLGNPAGVCFVEKLKDIQMQIIATKNNFSETAFISRLPKSNEFRIRFFTPNIEIDLCGHATVAAARFLFENYEINKVTFHANKTQLLCNIQENEVSLLLPKQSIRKSNPTTEIQNVLGSECIDFYETEIHYIGVMKSFKSLINWKNDFYNSGPYEKDQLILTSENKDYDYALRMFGSKKLGVKEDPVTGSAQPPLFEYWSQIKNKSKYLTAYQASHEGGILKVSNNIKGIHIKGEVKLIKNFIQNI